MLDTTVPETIDWWAARLLKALGEAAPRYQMLASYYRNQNGIPVTANKAVKASYQRLMSMSRTNFAELVVEAVGDRMEPVGFRTGAEGDGPDDAEAWRIWQANELDSDWALLARAQLALGDGYVIVGGVDPDIEAPLITVEDPRQVITEQDPIRRRQARAALKVYRDDVAGADVLYLYLPGKVYRASRQTPGIEITLSTDGWEWEDPKGKDLPAPVVPVFRFANNVDLDSGRSWGEFEPHLSVLDRVNFGTLQRVEIATLQAYRQRGIKGVPDVDYEGEPINYGDVFSADPGALWILPETAEIWESGQVDLTPIRQAGRDDVQDLAAVTRTPLFYLTAEAADGSAEGAALAREALVFKTRARLRPAGESLEQVMSCAFRFAGDTERAKRRDLEVLWADPERHSLAEKADSATKLQGAGVPWQQVMTDVLQYSPQAVARMQAQRATDALLGSITAEGSAPAPDDAGELAKLIQQIYLGVNTVVTVDEARDILNRAGAGLTGPAPGGSAPPG